MGPSFRLWNMSPVRFLFSFSLYSSTGVHEQFINRNILEWLRHFFDITGIMGTLPLTWVRGQVLEVHWLADLAVWGPTQLHLDSDGLGEVSIAVRRCAEHNGHLPVDVSLREGAFSLPGVLKEAHLDVLYKGTQNGKCGDKIENINFTLLTAQLKYCKWVLW